MSVTVQIEVEDDGSVTVGQPPEDSGAEGATPSGSMPGGMPMGTMMASGGTGASGSEEKADKSFMQPAASIDDALQKARAILTQGQPEAQGNIWDRVKRDKQMASQPGGPMMGMR